MELTCTGCGGSLPPEAARAPVTCRYCGTASVPVPAVVERVVERLVVERIGGADPAGQSDAGRLPCPRCAQWLTEKRVGGAVLASCNASCGGLWLDTATVERLKKRHEEEIETTAHRLLCRVQLLIADPPDPRMAISCPVCKGPLRRVEIPDTLHSIDVCDAHGTWFDRARGDELQMFVSQAEAARAGEVSEDDLRSAGVGGGGFFARIFRPRA